MQNCRDSRKSINFINISSHLYRLLISEYISRDSTTAFFKSSGQFLVEICHANFLTTSSEKVKATLKTHSIF